jgi:hypothetical protein
MKSILKKAFRLIKLLLIIVLALTGGFAMMAPRRPEQDYDNEIKTELVEGKETAVHDAKT